MEKYAVIKIASSQFLVQEGDVFEMERQKTPLKVEVLAYVDGDKKMIGEPTLSEIEVKLSVLEEKLDKKVRVARFKKKSRYEKVKGHRQPISVIKVEKVGLAGEKSAKKEEVKEEKAEKTEVVKKETPKTVVKKAAVKKSAAKKVVKKSKEAK